MELNAWAVWLLSQLAAPPAADAALAKRWSALEAAAASWKAALATQITKDAAAARAARPTPRRYDDLEALSWARLALGTKWAPEGQQQGGADVAADLAFSRLTASWRNLTVGGQARVGLALLRDNGDAALLGAITKALVGSVRVAGRTAYVASAPGERGSAGECRMW